MNSLNNSKRYSWLLNPLTPFKNSVKENYPENFHYQYFPCKNEGNYFMGEYQPEYYDENMESVCLFTGYIKFFDNKQNYGFFIVENDGSDLFVHYDNFLKAGMNKDHIQMAKRLKLRFAFRKVTYYGKYNLSSKAIDIQFIPDDY